MPESIEIWFLSPIKVSSLTPFIKPEPIFTSSLLAQNEEVYECVKMGDGCFHPQFGYIDKKSSFVNKKPKEAEKKELEKEVELKVFNSNQVEMVDCDKEFYFDMYCGKATKPTAVGPYEIWVDTSSSMRRVDYADGEYCHRRNFIEKILRECPHGKVSVSVFDTAIKQMGETSSLCQNYGNNDFKRFKQWVVSSKAKKLIIVTDIDERSLEMANFIDTYGIKVVGVGSKDFLASDLISLAPTINSFCH